MKFIQRWGLMRNTHMENIQEHSARVAMIAYTLAVIRKRVERMEIDPERTALLALFHDASEVITGDLPTPIKYYNPGIKDAYREVEEIANDRFLSMVPEALRGDFESVFQEGGEDGEHWTLVKAADKLCAYIKCLEENQAGNREFDKAEKALRETLDAMGLPEVEYFLTTFIPSFDLTLDELG
jgi:5'-deoxynucleotidase